MLRSRTITKAVDRLRLCVPVLLLGSMLSVPQDSRAQHQIGNNWVGKRCLQKSRDLTLKMGDQKDCRQSRILTYFALQIDGPWVGLRAERGNVGGWALADQVVDVEDAVSFFTEKIRANPADSFSYCLRAMALADPARWQGRPIEGALVDPVPEQAIDGALADFNEAIRLDPTFVDAYVGRSRAWLAKQDVEKAIADFSEAIRLDPGYVEAYLERAFARFNKKENDEAIADFSEAIRLGSCNIHAYICRALAWGQKKDYDKAIADFSEAIRLDPRFAMAYSERGRSWQAKRAHDKAIADFTEAIRLNPFDERAYLHRSEAWQAKGEYKKASDDHDQALRLDPRVGMTVRTPDTIQVAADDTFVAGIKASFALAGLMRIGPMGFTSRGTPVPDPSSEPIGGVPQLVVRSGPDNPDYNARGLDWLLKGKFDEAINDFKLAIRVGQENAETYCNLANAHRGKKNYAEALADYDKAVGIEPGDLYALTSGAWIRATCPDPKCRDGAKAIESATRACEFWDWKDARSVGILAAAHAEAGNFDAAVKLQTQAIGLLKDDRENQAFGSRLKLYQERHPCRDAGG